MAYRALHDAIMALPHSGAGGFEGFVADMLGEVTGLAFTTQKSGAQNGTDALASTFTIGIEAKQYKESSPLSVGELKAKLIDAASTNPELELWLLATTRSIDPVDAKALGDLAATFGIHALVLAWDVGTAGIPPLALLCALARTAVASQLKPDAAVHADLKAVMNHAQFATQAERVSAILPQNWAGASPQNHL